MLCPWSRGVNTLSIVRVATRYRWEQVRLPRRTYVIGYCSDKYALNITMATTSTPSWLDFLITSDIDVAGYTL